MIVDAKSSFSSVSEQLVSKQEYQFARLIFETIIKYCILYITISVYSEISARILFSRIALKDIFATLRIRVCGMTYLHQ